MVQTRKSAARAIQNAFGIGLLLVLSSVSGAGRPARAHTFPAKVTLVCSGELGGEFEPLDCPSCGGGIARRHTLLRALRLEEQSVVLLENGDITRGAAPESETQFQAAVLAMNEMGYDVFNIGELDAVMGPRFLMNMAERAKCAFISANLADANGERFFPAYTIVERAIAGKTIRIAVIGLLSSRAGDYLAKFPELNVKVLDAKEALETTLKRLRGKADLRVLLAHAPPEEVISLSRNHPDLDIAIYAHEAAHPAEHPSSGDDLILLGGGKEGQFLARLDIFVDESLSIVSHKFSALALPDTIPDSPVVRMILDSSTKFMVEQRLLSPQSAKKPYKGGFFVGSSRCAECHEEQFSIWSDGPHSRSFATLENQGQQSDPACLRCHTTGYRLFTGFESAAKTSDLANVGCEACHGVGSNHISNPTKRYGKMSRGDCKSCHDKRNSPRFNYTEYYKKIAHPVQPKQGRDTD